MERDDLIVPDTEANDVAADSDIAIIGIACRFPGADDPTAFWRLLSEGRDARTTLSDEALQQAGVPDSVLRDPAYVKSGLFLEAMEQFDAGFFGFSPLDASILDPQHRHFLECAWEAFEDAGYDPRRFDGPVGVFAGSGQGSYLYTNLLANARLKSDVGSFLLRHTGNDKDFLATRLSYCFDLRGPSINIQTACSTSAVAVHQAIQSLLTLECDMALAGGVTIELPHRQGYLHKQGEILSSDGICRPFDARSNGTVFGSGAGVLLLKRLDQAIADRDQIHAVIRGSAVNNDGAGKSGYLAPSFDGQAAVVSEALSVAQVSPESITFVEAHGTGTPLGDPIEIAALTHAYRGRAGARRRCLVGSVKGNIGHLDTAAGVAGIIKAVLALKHRQIPATAHFQAPNPAIAFDVSPFDVNPSLRDWEAPFPRRAGVHSLGVGGTNAHIVLEEAPPRPASAAGRRWKILPLSARSRPALQAGVRRLAAHLAGDGRGQALGDIAYTLCEGRRHFAQRVFVVASTSEEARDQLSAPEGLVVRSAPDTVRKIAFLFAGGGAQFPNMGRTLHESEPEYRDVVEQCLRLVGRCVDFDLRALIHPAAGDEAAAAEQLSRPSRALPAIFIAQYAQARLWAAWGVTPAALLGHSLGETTAACLAGVLSLDDAIRLVVLRGRLLESLAEGGMLSVNLPSASVLPMLAEGLGIGAENAPDLTMVTGPVAALARLERRLIDRDIACQRLHINVAAHSSLVDPILDAFRAFLGTIALRPPQVPILSNVTGTWMTDAEATSPDYWTRQLRSTVRFEKCVGVLLASGDHVLLEVGPGRVLSVLAGGHPARRPDHDVVSSAQHVDKGICDLRAMLMALGSLWQAGLPVDWHALHRGETRYRVSLPTYAFDHARHWVDFEPPGSAADPDGDNVDAWFHSPVWLPRSLGRPSEVVRRPALLLGNTDAIDTLLQAAGAGGEDLFVARLGDRFEPMSPRQWRVRPGSADLRQVAQAMAASGSGAATVFIAAAGPLAELRAEAVETGLRSLVSCIPSLAESPLDIDAWVVLTRGACRLPGERRLADPVAASLAGALGPIASELELPAILLDLPEQDDGFAWRDPAWSGVAARGLLKVLACRHGELHERAFHPAVAPSRHASPSREGILPREGSRLREDGVYLITGGTGGIGLSLAAHLLSMPGVRVALLSRRGDRAAGSPAFYAQSSMRIRERLEKLSALQAAGPRLMVLSADVADPAAMAPAIATIESRWGAIHGVFHTAGLLDDQLVPLMTDAVAAAVLQPKVAGLLSLDRCLAARPLDFLMLFSSTSAFAGIPGQTAYAAANAFMDAFALHGANPAHPTISVNWAAWRRVGMTAGLLADSGAQPAITADARTDVTGSRFRRLLDADDWVVADHRTRQGMRLLPGTGFVALALEAADALLPGEGPVELRDLELVAPLILAPPERVVVSVNVDAAGRFSICSAVDAEAADAAAWSAVHAHGLAMRHGETRADRPLQRHEADGGRSLTFVDGRLDHGQMDFGGRWLCVESHRYAPAHAMARLQLAGEYLADLDEHPFHPALLDMALGAARGLADGPDEAGEFLVPHRYDRVLAFGRLPGRVASLLTRSAHYGHDRPAFDAVLTDEAGRTVMTFEGFTLIRLDARALDRQAPRRRTRDDAGEVDALLARGIEPALGVEAIERVLTLRGIAQIVVSPTEPSARPPAKAAAVPGRQVDPPAGDASGSLGRLADDDAPSEDLPQSALARELAALWTAALGVARIGLRDNFFELGGHSLQLIRVATAARRHAGIDLPVSELYARPTIADWLQIVEQRSAEQRGAPGATDRQAPVLKRVSREVYRVASRDPDPVATGEGPP